MTAIPWGQKNRRSEMIQSQMVTPPLAAMEGTTLRLKTATTKSSTRSRRPRARIRWGCSADCGVVDKISLRADCLASFDGQPRRLSLHEWCWCMQGGRGRPPHIDQNQLLLVRNCYRSGALLLRFRQRGSDVVERREMLVDIGLGVLDRNRP